MQYQQDSDYDIYNSRKITCEAADCKNKRCIWRRDRRYGRAAFDSADAAGSTGRVGRAQRDEKCLCPLAVRITAASYDGLTASWRPTRRNRQRKSATAAKNLKIPRPRPRKHAKKLSQNSAGQFYAFLSGIWRQQKRFFGGNHVQSFLKRKLLSLWRLCLSGLKSRPEGRPCLFVPGYTI